MTDYIFLTIALVFFILSWVGGVNPVRSEYRWISAALLADFCAHIGFDTYMLSGSIQNLVGSDYVYLIYMPLKGTISLIFFLVFLNVCIHLSKTMHSFYTAMLLSGLSAFSAVFHYFVAKFNFAGDYFEPYTDIMTVYCVLQLAVMLGGLLYGCIHRPGISSDSWHHNINDH